MKTEETTAKKGPIEAIIGQVLDNYGYTLKDLSMVSVEEEKDLSKEGEDVGKANALRALDFIYNHEDDHQKENLLRALENMNALICGGTKRPKADLWESICDSATDNLLAAALKTLREYDLPFEEWQEMHERNRAKSDISALAFGKMGQPGRTFEQWVETYESSSPNSKAFLVKQLALDRISKFIRPFVDWQAIWKGGLTEKEKERNKELRLLAFQMMIGENGAKTYEEWQYVCEECMNGGLKLAYQDRMSIIKGGRLESTAEADIRHIMSLALVQMAQTATSFHELHTVLKYGKEYSPATPQGVFKQLALNKMAKIAKTFGAWRIIWENAHDRKIRALAETKMMEFFRGEKKSITTYTTT